MYIERNEASLWHIWGLGGWVYCSLVVKILEYVREGGREEGRKEYYLNCLPAAIVQIINHYAMQLLHPIPKPTILECLL